jgi:flagellar biosynthesis chaperone FliJ
MGYKFPLATLLQVRAIREENEERVLLQIGAEIARTQELQADVSRALERFSANGNAQTGAPLRGSDLQSRYAELHALWQSREDLGNHMQRLHDLKQKQMNIYTVARQNREMLTDMNDNKREEYYAALDKREQKTIADNFLARHKKRAR